MAPQTPVLAGEAPVQHSFVAVLCEQIPHLREELADVVSRRELLVSPQSRKNLLNALGV